MYKIRLAITIGLISTACFFSCSGGNFESKVKGFMKDSVVPKLDDPSSYQYVSMSQPDTTYNHAFEQEMLDFDQKTLKEDEDAMAREAADTSDPIIKSSYDDNKKQVAELNDNIKGYNEQLKQPDYVLYVDAIVHFRAKNPMGAIVLNQIKVNYRPAVDSLKRPEEFWAAKIEPANQEGSDR